MKIGILITHPTQFDVPVFRLGSQYVEVIYTDRNRVEKIYDPELKRTVSWEQDNLEGYRYKTVPAKRGIGWLLSLLRKEKYDLLITNGYYNKYFVCGLIAGKFFAKRNAIRVDTVEFNSRSVLNQVYKKTLYLVLKLLVDHFFVVSSLSRHFLLKQGVKPGRISLYGYVSDNDFFSQGADLSIMEKQSLKEKWNMPANKRVVLCVSKHSRREAPFDTLEAFRKLNDDSLQLVLVGDGPIHDEVVMKAHQLQIKNVTFTGYIPFLQLPAMYGIADLFVHDSHNEPWGVSVQEAMACMIPVVTSDRVGSSVDLIIAGKNGFVAKAGDTQDLASKIKFALQLDNKILVKTNNQILSNWNFKTSLDNIRSVASN